MAFVLLAGFYQRLTEVAKGDGRAQRPDLSSCIVPSGRFVLLNADLVQGDRQLISEEINVVAITVQSQEVNAPIPLQIGLPGCVTYP